MNPTGHPPEEILSAWLDGALGPGEREELGAHLAACPPCRAQAEALRQLSGSLAAEPVPPVPAGLADRIGWRIRGQVRRPARSAPWWRRAFPLTATASLAAAAILTAVLVHEGAFRGTGNGMLQEETIDSLAAGPTTGGVAEAPDAVRTPEPAPQPEKAEEATPPAAAPRRPAPPFPAEQELPPAPAREEIPAERPRVAERRREPAPSPVPVPETTALALPARGAVAEPVWEVGDLAAGAAILREAVEELGGALDTASRRRLFVLPGEMPVEIRIPAGHRAELLERLRELGVRGLPEALEEHEGSAVLLLRIRAGNGPPDR